MFSGSAVVDSENTSGFFPDQDDGVVAMYTHHSTSSVETQHIAYSTDGGYTFTKYADNPVIDFDGDDFRDPQVTWHEPTRRWVMFIAWANAREIGIYTSPDLIDWTPTSNFTDPGHPGVEFEGLEFECPNLVRVPVEDSESDEEAKDVLFISVNPGAPLGGSGTFYVVGNFNGTHFESEEEHQLYDFTKDNYASQWFSGLPEDSLPISIGWASNWEYTQEVPTDTEGWRGSMALPREHTLVKVDGDWIVTQVPFKGLSPVKAEELPKETSDSGDVLIDFSNVASNAISFDVFVDEIPSDPSGEVRFNFTSSTSEEYLDGGIILDTGFFWINRAGTTLFTTADNPGFTPDFNTTISLESGQFAFSGVIDRSVFEVFINGGKETGTMVFYSASALDTLTVSTPELYEGPTVDVNAFGIESGWSSGAVKSPSRACRA